MNTTPYYELSTGQPFFYAGYNNSLCQLTFCYRMLDTVDRDDLQKACDMVLPRFPYFCAKASIKDGRYILERNDAPFIVTEGDYPIAPGSEKANGHLLTIGCSHHLIPFSFFHGLADARGMMSLIQAVLFHYCEIHYHLSLHSPGLVDLQEPPSETEYADPFSFVEPQEGALPLRKDKKPFLLPERRILPGCHQKVFPVIIPQNTFLRFTKSHDASPAVMAALLLARAIDEVHPEHTEPVCVSIPVDFRSIVGHPEMRQNSVCPIMLEYTDKMRGLPLETQATMFRGQVFLKSDPPTVMNCVSGTKQFARDVNRMESLEEKIRIYQGIMDVPVVSYAGKTDWGDVNTYITQMCMCASADMPGININIFNIGTNLEFSIMVGTETNAYYEAFLHQLDLNEVHYYLGKPVSFVPPKREF